VVITDAGIWQRRSLRILQAWISSPFNFGWFIKRCPYFLFCFSLSLSRILSVTSEALKWMRNFLFLSISPLSSFRMHPCCSLIPSSVLCPCQALFSALRDIKCSGLHTPPPPVSMSVLNNRNTFAFLVGACLLFVYPFFILFSFSISPLEPVKKRPISAKVAPFRHLEQV